MSENGSDTNSLFEEIAANFELEPLRDADGCVVELYYYLWQKGRTGRSCPGVNLPETVVFKNRQPVDYFFTSSHELQIKKKHKQNCTDVQIFDNFLKKRKSAGTKELDVCASYMHLRDLDNPSLQAPSLEDTCTLVEYFDPAGLKNFMFRTQKAFHGGVLQKFLPTRGEHHTVIRSTWSPQLCLLDRRVNNHRLRDRQIDLFKRCVTFEGSTQFSQSAPLTAPSLATQLQQVCNSIVEHVFDVSGHRISRMVCNFKMDEAGKLWFLWCSSLRLARSAISNQPSVPLNLDPEFQLAPQVKIVGETKGPATACEAPKLRHHQSFDCPCCGKPTSVHDQYEVTYKAVIQHWNRKRAQTKPHMVKTLAEFERAQREIPAIIQANEGGLTLEMFNVLKMDPTFLYRCVALCEACCLDHNETVLSSLSTQNPSAQESVPGMGRPSSASSTKSHNSRASLSNSFAVPVPLDEFTGSTKTRNSSRPISSPAYSSKFTGRKNAEPQARRPASAQVHQGRPEAGARSASSGYSANMRPPERPLSAYSSEEDDLLDEDDERLLCKQSNSTGGGGRMYQRPSSARAKRNESGFDVSDIAGFEPKRPTSAKEPRYGGAPAGRSGDRPSSAPLARKDDLWTQSSLKPIRESSELYLSSEGGMAARQVAAELGLDVYDEDCNYDEEIPQVDEDLLESTLDLPAWTEPRRLSGHSSASSDSRRGGRPTSARGQRPVSAQEKGLGFHGMEEEEGHPRPRPRPPSAPAIRGASRQQQQQQQGRVPPSLSQESSNSSSSSRVEYTPSPSATRGQRNSPRKPKQNLRFKGEEDTMAEREKERAARSRREAEDGKKGPGQSKGLPTKSPARDGKQVMPPPSQTRSEQLQSAYARTPASHRPKKSALAKHPVIKAQIAKETAKNAGTVRPISAGRRGVAEKEVVAELLKSSGTGSVLTVNSQLTPAQEQLVRQALASAATEDDDHAPRFNRNMDIDEDALYSLIDDLRDSKSSSGSLAHAWAQIHGQLEEEEDEDAEAETGMYYQHDNNMPFNVQAQSSPMFSDDEEAYILYAQEQSDHQGTSSFIVEADPGAKNKETDSGIDFSLDSYVGLGGAKASDPDFKSTLRAEIEARNEMLRHQRSPTKQNMNLVFKTPPGDSPGKSTENQSENAHLAEAASTSCYNELMDTRFDSGSNMLEEQSTQNVADPEPTDKMIPVEVPASQQARQQTISGSIVHDLSPEEMQYLLDTVR